MKKANLAIIKQDWFRLSLLCRNDSSWKSELSSKRFFFVLQAWELSFYTNEVRGSPTFQTNSKKQNEKEILF